MCTMQDIAEVDLEEDKLQKQRSAYDSHFQRSSIDSIPWPKVLKCKVPEKVVN
jgi:hypothetical protein